MRDPDYYSSLASALEDFKTVSEANASAKATANATGYNPLADMKAVGSSTPKIGDPVTGNVTPIITTPAASTGLFVGPIPTGTTRTATGYTTPEPNPPAGTFIRWDYVGQTATTGTLRRAVVADGKGGEKLTYTTEKNPDYVPGSRGGGGGGGGGGGLGGNTGSQLPVKPTVVTQKTKRKTGGVVQTVNVMSDGTEVVIDEYKDYSARDAVMAMFENTGLGDTFLNSLMASIDQVYNDNIAPTDAQILNSIYNSDAYKTRFAANETIRKRMAEGKGRPGDRLLKPAEYIETENTYRQIMSAAGLPAGFYDTQDDFSNFIANGVSASELTSRVNIAKSALQNADQGIVDSLKNFYGLTTSDMVAYLLDKDKAFNLIEGRFNLSTAEAEKQYGAAEIGGAAQRAGMVSDKALAEEIYGAGKGAQAEQAFQSAAEKKADYRRLRNLYGQTGEDTDLVRQELALAGGAESAIQTKKLASKERAKFQQGSAITQTSLGRRNRLADV